MKNPWLIGLLAVGVIASGCEKKPPQASGKDTAAKKAPLDSGPAAGKADVPPAVKVADVAAAKPGPDAAAAKDSAAAGDTGSPKDGGAAGSADGASDGGTAKDVAVALRELDPAVPGVARMRFPLKTFPTIDMDNARKHVHRAARFVRLKKFGKAIGAYQKALTLDPNSWSRYELMTTYIRAGLNEQALSVLKGLRDWADSKHECFICKVWLAKSTTDALFAPVHKDPRYVKMVAGPELEEPDYELMVRKFLLEVENNDRTMLKATLEHQLVVRIEDQTRAVDAKTKKDSGWEDGSVYFTKFEDIEKASLSKYDEPKSIRCKSRCCRVRYAGEYVKRKVKVGATTEVAPEPCDFNRLDRICMWPFGKEDVAIVVLEQRLCEVKAMAVDDLIDKVGKPGWTVPGAKKKPDDKGPATDREVPSGKPTVISPPENL